MIRQLTNNNAKLSLTSAPTTGDRMREGKFWLKQDTNELYALLDVTGGVATWDKVLTANSTLPMDTQTDPLVDTALVTAVLDAYSGVIILTTGAGADQTFGVPTNTDPGSRFWVVNDDSSSHSFDVIGARTITIDPGEAEQYMWDGDAWIHITAADAEDITFNPAVSYLSDTNVQSAIDSFAPTTEGIVEASRALVSDSNLDLNFSGGYLLNDQTTTNMMSKGTVYRLDGTDDLISIPDSGDLSFGNSVSDSPFTFHRKIRTPSTFNTEPLISKGSSAAREYAVYLSSGKIVVVLYDNDGANRIGILADTALSASTQYDITITYDGSGVYTGIKAYVNGVLISVAENSAGSYTAMHNQAQSATIGRLFNDGSDYGEFEDSSICVLNLEATASEVKDLISGNIPFKWQYGSQTDKIVEANDRTFGGAVVNWAAWSGGAIVTDTGEGKITFDTGNSWSGAQLTAVGTLGKRYRVSMDLRSDTGEGNLTDINIGWNVNSVADENISWQTETITEAGITVAFDVFCKVDTYFRIGKDNAAAEIIFIDNCSIIELGAVALYTQDSISDGYWYDVSGNDNHGTKTGAEVLSYKGWHSDGTDLYTDGAATFGGHVRIPATKYLYLDGGSNTYLHEVSADKLDIVVGNYTMMSFDEQSSPKLIYINPSTSEDMDFAVGSNAGVNAIYVDGTDASSTFGGDVGIGGSADLLSAGTAATVATIQGLTTNRGRLEIASATVTGSGVVGDIQFVRGVDNVASVECSLDGADDAGVISFYTQPTGDVATKRWSILSNGTFEGTGARTIQTTSNNLLTLNGGTGGVSIGDKLILPTSSTPASAGATGVAGTVAWDANYIYVCSATNTWLRAAIATW